MRTLQAFDVDTDALADTLERMADGIREGGIMVEEVETGHKAAAEDPSTFTFGLQFVATADYKDVVDSIEYDARPDDFDAYWRRFEKTDSDLTDRLAFSERLADTMDKSYARQMYEDDRLTFAGTVPVVTPFDADTDDGGDE